MVIKQLSSNVSQMETLRKQTASCEQTIELSTLSYGVNIHLEDQDAVESALNNLGVPDITTFGVGSGKPDNLVVAVAKNLPEDAVKEVLSMANRLGFEHFTIIEPWEEIEEDVLFGAYATDSRKITFNNTGLHTQKGE